MNLFFEMQNRIKIRRQKRRSVLYIFGRSDDLVDRDVSVETDKHVTDIFVDVYFLQFIKIW